MTTKNKFYTFYDLEAMRNSLCEDLFQAVNNSVMEKCSCCYKVSSNVSSFVEMCHDQIQREIEERLKELCI